MSLLYKGSFRMPGSCELYLRALTFKETRDIDMYTVISNKSFISCSTQRNASQLPENKHTKQKSNFKNPFFFFYFQYVFLCLFLFSVFLSFFPSFFSFPPLYVFLSSSVPFFSSLLILLSSLFLHFVYSWLFICSFLFWQSWLSFFLQVTVLFH